MFNVTLNLLENKSKITNNYENEFFLWGNNQRDTASSRPNVKMARANGLYMLMMNFDQGRVPVVWMSARVLTAFLTLPNFQLCFYLTTRERN